MTGYKRPLIDIDESIHPNALILRDQRLDKFSVSSELHRVYKHHYPCDASGTDPDDSTECEGYSDIASLVSGFSEYVSISDQMIEVCAQMIEDPRSDMWSMLCPEAAHIKHKAKCFKSESNDVNNFIYMARTLHVFFDGLKQQTTQFPIC